MHFTYPLAKVVGELLFQQFQVAQQGIISCFKVFSQASQ